MRQIIVYVSDTEKEPELLCKAFEAFIGVDRVEMIDTEDEEEEEPEIEKLYIVRGYDGFDNQWYDVTKPVPKADADKVWNEHTKNGTEKTNYGDIDYYKVFPASTKMLYSNGHGEI
jgi:hypothetical protein